MDIVKAPLATGDYNSNYISKIETAMENLFDT